MRRIFFPPILAIFLLVSCSPSPHISQKNEDFLKSISGSPGIIGLPNFEFSPSNDEYARAWAATGLIKVYSEDNKESKFATGVLVKKSQSDEQLYVLTAKHVAYNLDTGEIFGKKAVIGFDVGSKKFAYLQMKQLPEKLAEIGVIDDFIFVPVLETDIDPILISRNATLIKNQLLPETNLFSVSTFFRQTDVYKVLQKDFSVFKKKNPVPSNNLIATDMDGMVGASGSPIFILDDSGQVAVVGVLTSTSKQPGCKKYIDFFCSNTITLLK